MLCINKKTKEWTLETKEVPEMKIPVLVPKLSQSRKYVPYNKWYSDNQFHVDKIVYTLFNSINSMDSSNFDLHIDDDKFVDKLYNFVYKTSYTAFR
jgi:hypothetical protein